MPASVLSRHPRPNFRQNAHLCSLRLYPHMRCIVIRFLIAAVALFGAAQTPNAQTPSEVCVKEFATLREEAVARGKLIKDASARYATPDVTCKLIFDLARSEIKMMKYLEANSADCGIPPQIGDQIRIGHKDTEAMQIKVCNAAAKVRGVSEPPGPVGDFPELDRR